MDVFMALVLGLVAGSAGALWIVAPLIDPEAAHRALACYLAQRQIKQIETEALGRMASVVASARRAESGQLIVPPFDNQRTAGDFNEADRAAPGRTAGARP